MPIAMGAGSEIPLGRMHIFDASADFVGGHVVGNISWNLLTIRMRIGTLLSARCVIIKSTIQGFLMFLADGIIGNARKVAAFVFYTFFPAATSPQGESGNSGDVRTTHYQEA